MKLVETKKGPITGIEKDGYTLFLGIPYAQPPVGELRWRAPLEVPSWENIYCADKFPNRSMQDLKGGGAFFAKEFDHAPELLTPVSEDSLYLNIWTPAEEAGEKLPVAFWIHGGAFLGGFGHEKEFDGEEYCKRGVILVTANYRLGPLGFLAHPWLSEENRAEGGAGVSGNYGILDQIAALRWIFENIGAFGGDPENITVFGQSAGGESVHTLLNSPLTERMIAKVIIQSGLGLNSDRTLEQQEIYGTEFAENADVHSLEELRALSADQIFNAAGPLIARGFATGNMPFAPNVDGYVLHCGTQKAMELGKAYDIPSITGSTMHDMWVDPNKFANGERGLIYENCKIWGNMQMTHGCNPAYVYYFTRQLPGDDAGAFHSSELWYIFGTYGRCWRPMTKKDTQLSADMMNYWTNFMKTGDPNGKNLARWNPYRMDEDIQILDV